MASAGKEPRSGSAATLVLGAVVIAVAAMLIVPLPPWLLDLLITLNLGVSLLLLLSAGYARSPLGMTTFPTLLVLTTLFRLALNVSTVRLILLSPDNPGRVVPAFGNFVVRGDYVVGGAVFLILTIVQYVVIARGAERVAEVAARFTLDAMPGRQLAIDADLRARSIEAGEARRRRAALQREAQLYGALDGAMRFVKGDAVAALAILAISLVGGLGIGTLRRGMPLGDAAQLYTLLTVGDGLASQIPALLIATAAGLLVTRVADSEEGAPLHGELARQLLGRPELLFAVAALLGLLALLPGLPLLPFSVGALVFAGGALYLLRRSKEEPARDQSSPSAAPLLPRPPPPLELVLPRALLGAPGLQAAVERRLRALVDDLGVATPPLSLRATDDGPGEVRLFGVPIGAIDSSGAAAARDAEAMATAVERALRRAAPSLLGLDETERMVEALAARCPALCREVIPRRVDLPTLAEVLRRLVAEDVPIGDLREVLEALAAVPAAEAEGGAGREAGVLVERVRRRLSSRISARVAPGGAVRALLLDPLVEDTVREAARSGPRLALEPALVDDILEQVGRKAGTAALGGEDADAGDAPGNGAANGHAGRPRSAVLLVPGDLRPPLARLLAETRPEVAVVAYEELLPGVEIVEAGRVETGTG